MPIRIKPIHDLGPCRLILESIESITQIVEDNFQGITYSAYDNVWEIYAEPRDIFLKAIAQRDGLESLMIEAP